MGEIDWAREEHWRRLEEWGVIEWAPDKSEFFLTEKVKASLEKAEEILVSKGISFRDISDDTELANFCIAAAIAHIQPVTTEDLHFLTNFLFKFHKAGITKAEMEDRVLRPGFMWPKK